MKTQSVLTGWLTSANLSQWNFGGSRLESLRPIVHDFYAGQPPVLVEALGVLGPVLLALAAMGLLAAGPRYWLRAGGLGLGFLSGPLIFANLYMVHNYYWVAVLPFGAAFIALGLERLIALVARLARRQRGLLEHRAALPPVGLGLLPLGRHLSRCGAGVASGKPGQGGRPPPSTLCLHMSTLF